MSREDLAHCSFAPLVNDPVVRGGVAHHGAFPPLAIRTAIKTSSVCRNYMRPVRPWIAESVGLVVVLTASRSVNAPKGDSSATEDFP